MNGTIHIGTSGWQYKHWIGTFYPAGMAQSKMLAEYVKHFDTVELNSSFYHQPPRLTFENWKKKTPPGFSFSVKASRYITHNKKLHDAEESLDHFLKSAVGLGQKLGAVLFQTPPSWKIDLERLDTFLNRLPKKQACTFEFRHPSWMTEEVYAILHQHNAAFCIYELAGYRSPEIVTADFAYIRLHGPDGKYQGNYPNSTLKAWANKIEEWAGSLKQVYIYFDNDESGYAPNNALSLKRLLNQ